MSYLTYSPGCPRRAVTGSELKVAGPFLWSKNVSLLFAATLQPLVSGAELERVTFRSRRKPLQKQPIGLVLVELQNIWIPPKLKGVLWPSGARRAPSGPAGPAGPEGPRRPMGPEGPHGGVGMGWGGVGGWGGGVGPSPTGRGAGPESSSLNTAVERPACCQNLGGEKLFRVDGMPAYAD